MLIAILIILAILCLLGVIFRGNAPAGVVPGIAVVALVILVLLLLGYR